MLRSSLALASVLVAGLSVGLIGGPVLKGQAPVQTGIPKDHDSYSPVVKKVLPAVVSIETHPKPVVKQAKQPGRKRLPEGLDKQQLPEEFRKFLEDFGGQPFQFEFPDQSPATSFGSGFLVDAHGTILTNNHVVDNADEVEVQLADGRKFTSKDIKTDPKTDLAVVRIQTNESLPYLELGDSKAMEIGDRVLAVGAPFHLLGSVTAGIISGKGRNVHINMYEDFLQTDAAINPGNSGGPLVNLEGKVIGINTAIKSSSGGSQGVGLAIASDMAKRIMHDLLTNGHVSRGYLGVQVKDLDEEVASRLGLKEHQPGVLVAKVEDDSPAAKAGVKDGDVITELAGKKVLNRYDLVQRVGDLSAGKPAAMTVVRDGKPVSLQVSVAERPADEAAANNKPPRKEKGKTEEHTSTRMDKLGVAIADLTPEMAKQFGFKDKTAGAVVTEVEPGSLAAQAGLRPGMLVVKVDKKDVADAAAAHQAVDKADLQKGALLQIRTPDGGTDFVLLKESAEQK